MNKAQGSKNQGPAGVLSQLFKICKK